MFTNLMHEILIGMIYWYLCRFIHKTKRTSHKYIYLVNFQFILSWKTFLNSCLQMLIYELNETLIFYPNNQYWYLIFRLKTVFGVWQLIILQWYRIAFYSSQLKKILYWTSTKIKAIKWWQQIWSTPNLYFEIKCHTHDWYFQYHFQWLVG